MWDELSIERGNLFELLDCRVCLDAICEITHNNHVTADVSLIGIDPIKGRRAVTAHASLANGVIERNTKDWTVLREDDLVILD